MDKTLTKHRFNNINLKLFTIKHLQLKLSKHLTKFTRRDRSLAHSPRRIGTQHHRLW